MLLRVGIRCCVTIVRVMKERHIIIGVLRELGRRLWIDRAIREAAFAVCVILFCLVCFQLIGPALRAEVPSAGTVIPVTLLAAFAAVTVEVARRSVRGVSTGQAAAQADARAQLKDELKSAHWFLSEKESSPLAQLQVQRAAVTAAGLDLAILAPRRLPIGAFAAGGLGLLLAALIWMTPQLSSSWDSSHEAGAVEHGESADLRSLLKGAPHDAEVEKLDFALRKLQQTDASAEEKRRALADARDAIDQANMEASAAREGLARLAEALKSNPKFESAAQALNQGRVDDAMDFLRKLKADPAAAGAREDQAIEPADNGNATENSISQALESAGRDLTGKHAAVNQDAIDRVINTLEQANERIEVQNRINSVKRRMEDSLIATAQRSQLTASQFDNRTNAPNPTPSPETGNSNVRGGTLFRQAAVAREEGDTAREGSQTGDASGDSAALPLEGAATRRLDAQLKLETILQKGDAGEEPNGKGDQGWFYSASREQKSTLQIENVRSRAGYDREDAIDRDRVPLRQKNIVKNYFLNLHESEKK
jgi:hypothetical protein